MGGGLQKRAGPSIGWSLQPTGLQRIAIKLSTNNAKYTRHFILILIETNGGGSQQYIKHTILFTVVWNNLLQSCLFNCTAIVIQTRIRIYMIYRFLVENIVE